MLDLSRDAFESDEAGARGSERPDAERLYLLSHETNRVEPSPPRSNPSSRPNKCLSSASSVESPSRIAQRVAASCFFKKANLCREQHESSLNFFRVNASQPLSVWREKGWIYHEDPRGWFQWYCRSYAGRRSQDDQRQIRRWRAVRRHVAQVKKNCRSGDWTCRPRQRQALLHWAYDSRKI